MKHIILTGLLFSLLFVSAYSQTDNRPKDGPGFYFNSFQDNRDKNPDSALYFVRLLATNPNYTNTLQDLLHNSFAQVFQKMWERVIKDSVGKTKLKQRLEIGHQILNGMMADSNQNLASSAVPIYYWTQVQQNENNTKKLIELTNQFITTQLPSNDIYQNRVGRYALLIYQVISQKKELNNLAEQLFTITKNKLSLNQIVINVDTASYQTLEKRTWYRFLYAYCNYIEGEKLLEKRNTAQAGICFKTAFDYSPDLTDNNNSAAYFYDMYFLMEKEKRTFQDEYLAYLTNYSADKRATLSTLLTMSLTNPTYKEKLQAYYETNFPNQEPFANFWLNAINKNLKDAPEFSLTKIDGTQFSTADNKGKWLFLDFWGTWCTPCREEHPDLQAFYKYISTKDTSNFSLLTIACLDAKDKVTAYLTQYNYSFPVAMADESIESIYKINSYPSKILITPQGKYLIVPFGIDWVDFIKNYVSL